MFWELSVIRSGAPFFFRLWGVPFVVVGLYMVVGRFFWESHRKRATVYAITDRRALRLVGSRSVSDAPLAGQPVSTRIARDGRHATALIGPAGPLPWSGTNGAFPFGFTSPGRSVQFGFFDVADGREMLAALDQARDRASSAGS